MLSIGIFKIVAINWAAWEGWGHLNSGNVKIGQGWTLILELFHRIDTTKIYEMF